MNTRLQRWIIYIETQTNAADRKPNTETLLAAETKNKLEIKKSKEENEPQGDIMPQMETKAKPEPQDERNHQTESKNTAELMDAPKDKIEVLDVPKAEVDVMDISKGEVEVIDV